MRPFKLDQRDLTAEPILLRLLLASKAGEHVNLVERGEHEARDQKGKGAGAADGQALRLR